MYKIFPLSTEITFPVFALAGKRRKVSLADLKSSIIVNQSNSLQSEEFLLQFIALSLNQLKALD